MKIFCCQCKADVHARLTNGEEIYPHRTDLFELPFWKCDTCKNYVGCHHKTKDRTRPLGCIPTAKLLMARKAIHQKLDPLWQSGDFDRKDIYKELSHTIGREYHTADIRSIEEARMVYRKLNEISVGKNL